MTWNNKALPGVAILVLTGLLIYFGVSKKKTNRIKKENILDHVADEGYETAHDILYPLSRKRRVKWTSANYN